MTGPDFFEESLDAWRDARHGLIREVENIPESKFDFRPTPEVRSVGELVRHILEGSMMMVGELTREEPNFRRMSFSAFMKQYAAAARDAHGKEELIALLESQVDDGITRFKEVGADAMMGPVTNFDGSTWSRMQWFFHSMNEEHYHRGQLTIYARLLGLVPALTQQIMVAGGEASVVREADRLHSSAVKRESCYKDVETIRGFARPECLMRLTTSLLYTSDHHDTSKYMFEHWPALDGI